MIQLLHSNISVNSAGHLTFAGFDTVSLAEEFGTPLYLLDENRLRENCRTYASSMSRCFGGGSMALFASKALSFKGIYRIADEEGLGADVVSSGELYTALKAGFPPQRIFFHGNNKTDADIRYGVESGIGCFIVDGYEELEALGRIACELGKTQDVLLRLTPGIDPHTFEAVNTGRLDCQFGVPVIGQGMDFAKTALNTPGVRLRGFHCHIGSQIFDWIPFRDASDIMLSFMSDVKTALGYEAEVLNLGGGFGIRYTEADPVIDIGEQIAKTAEHVKSRCAELGLSLPSILMEPGRSIVADAGMTIYTVGSIKTIGEGYTNFVSVDGGMSDNPRYALYQAPYTVALASRANDPADFPCTVAGRCCESGALIQENVFLPRPVRGDKLAVFCTGAYNYSMASNYNRLPKPPIVMLTSEGPKVAVRRETFEDLTACDI